MYVGKLAQGNHLNSIHDAALKRLLDRVAEPSSSTETPTQSVHQFVGQVHGNVIILGGAVTETALELILKAQADQRAR